MPIFSPASPDAQVAPILQAHTADIKSQIPSELQSIAPKASPTNLFNDYLNTGNEMFKQAAGTALNKLQEFATDANTAAKKFTASGVPGLFSSSTPATYADALQQGVQNRVANIEKQTSNPETLAAGFTGEGEANAIKELPVIRAYSQDIGNVLSDKFRGGTWYSNSKKPVFNYADMQQTGYGGQSFIQKNLSLNNPYVVKIPGEIQQESGDALHTLAGKLFPEHQAVLQKIGFDKLSPEDKSNIQDLMKNVGVPDKQIQYSFRDGYPDEEAISDNLLSAKLKSLGHDSLVVRGKVYDYLNDSYHQGESIFHFPSDNSSIPAAPQGKISPTALFGGAAATVAAVPSMLDKLGTSTYTKQNQPAPILSDKIPQPIQQSFLKAASDNVPAPMLGQIVNVENKPFNPHAVRQNANGSQDYGLMQVNSSMIPWVQKQFKAQGSIFNPFNPDDSARGARMILEDNADKFTKSIGRAPTPDELVASYHIGLPETIAAARADIVAKQKEEAYVNRSKSS